MNEPQKVDSLLTQARELRNQASALLYDEGLLETIESVGPMRVVGSYALDLMTCPDIDFSLQLPHDLDIPTFFELGRRAVGKFQVTRMQFMNVFLRPFGSFDHGLYWGIQLIHSERTWKLDIWGFGKEAYAAHVRDFEELAARLASADRATILRIKNACCRRPEYGVKLSSWQIYEAITRHGVRNIEEFDVWWTAQRG